MQRSFTITKLAKNKTAKRQLSAFNLNSMTKEVMISIRKADQLYKLRSGSQKSTALATIANLASDD